MSKFKFRLSALLRLREMTRDERRAALAEAYRVDDTLRKQLDRLSEELNSLKTICRQAAGPGRVNIDCLVETQRYEMAMKVQQSQIVRQRETVAAEIDRRRQALIAADRDVRVLEKLREHQADQFRREEEHKDAKRLDEVAFQQAMREAVP